MTPGISPRQERIWRFVTGFVARHGYGPSVRQIMAGCEISSTSVVVFNVERLCGRGYLTRDPHIARSIRPVDQSSGTEVAA